jgi:methylmalonyl-CoA/ethylmalonyl-CoA epimerase
VTGCRVEHAAISATDLDRATAWYRDHFGFIEIRRTERPEHGLRTAVIRLGAADIEILQPDTPIPFPGGPTGLRYLLRPSGLNHLAIAVPDAKAARERFLAEGADLATEMIEDRLFFVRDPWGTLLEVKQAK